MQQQLPLTKRRFLAGLLVAAGIAYGALLVATYLQASPPSAIGPSLSELNRLLYGTYRPVSPMERRLEASDAPLGTGPLISGPRLNETSMRTAFYDPSDKRLNATDLAQREGERQALLDWIRSGASKTAYQNDDYALVHPASITTITPEFVFTSASVVESSAIPHVRIRSLINKRCVTCHVEDDGDDTARLIPFDSYESIARYLVPDDHGNGGRPWLLAALASLFPLAALVGPMFAFTRHPQAVRKRVLDVTVAALMIVAACWLAGSFLAPLLLAAVVVAVIGVMVQLLASVAELLGKQSV